MALRNSRSSYGGIVMMQADGKAVSLLGFAFSSLVAVDKSFAHTFGEVPGARSPA